LKGACTCLCVHGKRHRKLNERARPVSYHRPHSGSRLCEAFLFEMSLVRIAARLPLRTCLRTVNATCERQVQKQDTFEGVFDAYFWDEKTGFGVSSDGRRVLISSKYKAKRDPSSEDELWQEIIEPTSLLDHSGLRDELQMRILSYDSDVLLQDIDQTATQNVPIFKGDIQLNVHTDGTPPSGETAGFGGGSQTVTA